MKVMLIYPDVDPLSIIPGRLINIEPLQLEYLAAMIPDHDVMILDMKTDRHWKSVIEKFQPDLVGITGTVIHTHRILEVLRAVKQINPMALTVVGGPHATLVPDDFNEVAVDVIALRHSHQSFKHVVNNFDSSKPLHEIPDLAFPTSHGLSYTERGPIRCDLDDLPMPRRDLTARYRSKYNHLVWRKVALMIASAGCPHSCNFCPCPILTGRKVLRRSPEKVVQELTEIDEKYTYFGDDNFFFDPNHAGRIASLIEQAGIHKHFYALSRADSIVQRPDIVEQWASIGLKKVFIGLETVRDEDMKALHKKGSVDTNTRAIEILQANRIDPLGAFIIQPDYTEKDFENILRYMDRMKIYYFEFTVLTPFPGTPFYDLMRDKLLYTDTRLFDLAHPVLPTSLPLKDFYYLYSRLHRKAMGAGRAVRIRPVVSPFRPEPLARLLPGIVSLFRTSRRAQKLLRRMPTRPAH